MTQNPYHTKVAGQLVVLMDFEIPQMEFTLAMMLSRCEVYCIYYMQNSGLSLIGEGRGAVEAGCC